MSTHIMGKITKLFCQPKSDNWFAGLVTMPRGQTVRVAGVANVKVKINMMIEFDAIRRVDSYGEQYIPDAGSIIMRVLTSEKDIVGFLSSALFPGVGPKTAQKIYDRFGVDTIAILQDDIDYAAATCSLTKTQKDVLYKGVIALVGTAGLVKAYPHMRVKTADRILTEFNIRKISDVIDMISKNGPYRALRSFGVGTIETDEIGLDDCGVSETDDARLEMILMVAIHKFCSDRNATFVKISDPDEWLFFFLNYFLPVKLHKELPYVVNNMRFNENYLATWIADVLKRNAVNQFTVVNVDYVGETPYAALYDAEMLGAENHISTMIAEGTNSCRLVKQTLSSYMHNNSDIKSVYTKEQIDAVEDAFFRQISFISGGPGRGKTKTLSLLIELWRLFESRDILLLAPTGKAVNRMKAQTNYYNAETIARFLVTNKKKGDERDNPKLRTISGDLYSVSEKTLIIVDEASMLDFVTASHLLDLVYGCTVVFVGDMDQLSPIEPGPFFAECLGSNESRATILTKNFRIESPEISDNADTIMRQDDVSISDLKITPNFQLFPCAERPMENETVSQAEAFILSMYKTYMMQGADFNDIAVIAPFAKSRYRLSASNLNSVLQNELNPEYKMTGSIKMSNDDFGRYFDTRGSYAGMLDTLGVQVRVGDRIMNTKNNMDLGFSTFKNDNVGFLDDETTPDNNMGILNGDTGTVLRVYPPVADRDTYMILVELDDTRSENEKMAFPLPKKYVWVTAKQDNKGISQLENWCLAYAISVHKAQGSEAKHVIIALSDEGYQASKYMISRQVMPFLTKNMLYTAITRAKNTVTIVGSKDALLACMQTPYECTNTRLAKEIHIKSIQQLPF